MDNAIPPWALRRAQPGARGRDAPGRTPLPGNRSELIELVSRNTPAVTGYLLEPLASFLTIGRRIAGDDADKVLIMLVITLRATRSPEFQALDREQIESGEVPV